jgi:hypothetical protein
MKCARAASQARSSAAANEAIRIPYRARKSRKNKKIKFF